MTADIDYNEISKSLTTISLILTNFEKILNCVPDTRDHDNLKNDLKDLITKVHSKLEQFQEKGNESLNEKTKDIFKILDDLNDIIGKIHTVVNDDKILIEIKSNIENIESVLYTETVELKKHIVEVGKFVIFINKVIEDFKTVSRDAKKEIQLSDIHQVIDFCKTANNFMKIAKSSFFFLSKIIALISLLVGLIWGLFGDKIKLLIPFLN